MRRDEKISADYRRNNDGLSQILTQQGAYYLPYPQDVSELVSDVDRLCVGLSDELDTVFDASDAVFRKNQKNLK